MIRNSERMYATLLDMNYQEKLFGGLKSFEKKGAGSLACCPFHEDALPTLLVYADRPEYFCFVCSSRGDWLKYLQIREELSFAEALSRLGQEAEMPHVSYDKADWEDDLKRSSLLELAAPYFAAQLFAPAGEETLHYLYRRRYAMGEVEGSAFGYYPGFEQMRDYLRSQGVQEDILDGILPTIWNHEADNFTLTIPFRDSSGRLVGMIGRDISKTGQGAYTPLTDISMLKDIPFLMYRARRQEQVIVVEGLLDALLVDQIGFKPAVAIGKKGLSAGQADTIRAYGVQRCLLCLGNGNNKIRFTLEAAQMLQSRGIHADVLPLPDEFDDLDRFIRSTDLPDFKKLLKNPVRVSDWSSET